MTRTALWILVAAIAVGCAQASPTASAPRAEPLVVSKGSISERILLTGELAATKSAELKTPRTRSWRVAIRWLAKEGAKVKEGDRVVEFDNSQLVSELQDRALTELGAYNDLARQRATNRVAEADKEIAANRAQIAFTKAELEAKVPRDSVSRRVFEQRRLALEQARFALERALDDREATLKSGKLDLEIKRLALDKTGRAIETTKRSMKALVLTAPRDGVVSIGNHPWEGRKLEVGDSGWPGLTVVELPDLSEVGVKAKLSDVDDGRVTVGGKVTCTLDAFPDRQFVGKITSVSPVARAPQNQSDRRSFEVRIALDEADTEIMRPGMSVKVEVAALAVQDVLVVPRSAVDFEAEEKSVQLESGVSVPVVLGKCDAHRCEVTGELSEGARLLPAGTAQ
jgi:multidrug efflux pump subunit AcrA (membrane-fusion protein)